MRRLAIPFLMGLLGGPAAATPWVCQSGLDHAPHEPVNTLGFDLTLSEDGRFHAQGVEVVDREGTPFEWRGHYVRYDGQLAMIGPLSADWRPPLRETRAVSRVMEEDVLILTLTPDPGRVMMIRCLTHDLR